MSSPELAYPFLAETSSMVDWEISTDMLSSQISFATSLLAPTSAAVAVAPTLYRLAELVYHLNGSVRGQCAVESADLEWMHTEYEMLRARNTLPAVSPFVLPSGTPAAAQLHVARCQAKHCIRWLHRIRKEGDVVPDLVLRASGLVANLLFVLALDINRLDCCPEKPFIGRSYPVR